jgi:hypothetical protein
MSTQELISTRKQHPRPLDYFAGGISIVAILLLTYLTVIDGPRPIELGLQIVLLLSFGVLAIIDLRAAATIVILELIVFGSSGQWTQLLGGIHGRIALYSIVLARVVWTLATEWKRGEQKVLGRYGPHAMILAIILPGVWMPVGLLNGNEPRDVFADGNGYLFFAFALAFVALVRQGHAAWLRRWLLFACTVNAVIIMAIVVVTATGWVAMEPTMRYILTDQLLVGNSIGYLPNGAYRLYLASGMYLQVGIALTVAVLAENPRRWWAWALLVLFGACEVATYTRGFWLGAAIAFILAVALVPSTLRRTAELTAGVLGLAGAAVVLCFAVGFSLPGYLLERTESIIPNPGSSAPPPSSQPGFVPVPSVVPGIDTSGQVSSQVRFVQAQVLMSHIAQRPLAGFGFGSIAPDYPYGKTFSYELTYLDIAFKTGLVGLGLFLSFPLRVVIDALRARRRGLSAPEPEPRSTAAIGVVPAIVVSVLVLGATNPYFNAAFGLLAFLIPLAWLESGVGRKAAPAA